MSEWLDIQGIDLKPLENAEAHFTTKYQWQDISKIVVRRGFPVKIQLKTAGETFNPDIHVLVLEFELDEKVLIKEEDRFRRVRVRSPKEVRLDQSQWRAELMGIEDSFVDVRLTFPSRAPVACWKLRVLSGFWTSKTQMSDLEETFYSRLHAPVIYCIFNPFLVEDDVYLSQRQLREAYLFQDGELYFTGAAVGRRKYSFSKKPWMHSQFNESTLKVSILLLTILTNNYLNDKPGLTMEERGSVVRITRKLSFAINRYLLRGNWDKEHPEGGRPATSWLGTAEIIQEFMKSKRQVKYAQCWVFACSFVTILRTIGIPSRTVTCIESAHDADMSLTVDRAYLKTGDGGFIPIKGVDGIEWESTWSFHIWTEIWAKRRDLPDSSYDGWQVIDATPQEKSEKLFQCGPMSVKAIQEGRLDLPYDGWFIYSEVNADSVRWFYETDPKTGEMKLITTHFRNDSHDIGRALLTPNPRNYGYPMDLTSEYKSNEKGNGEKLVHIKALKSAGAAERHQRIKLLYGKDIDEHTPEDVEVLVEEIDKVYYGDEIIVEISVRNWSNSARTVKLHVDIATLFHTGTQSTKVSRWHESLTLEPRGGETIRLETPVSQYAKYISFLKDLGACVSASVEETDQVVFIEEKFQITGSSVMIEAPTMIKVGSPVIANITFQNPLNETLENVELILHGGNLSQPIRVSRFPRQVSTDLFLFHYCFSIVGPRKRIKIQVKFRAVGEGARLLVATVNSKQLKNMTATHYVRAVNIHPDDRVI